MKVLFLVVPIMLIGAFVLFAMANPAGEKETCIETFYDVPNPALHRIQTMWGFNDEELYLPFAPSSGNDGHVQKFDGVTVEPFFTAADNTFLSIWGFDNDNLWAVGRGVGTAGGAYKIDSDGIGVSYNLEQGIDSTYNHVRGISNSNAVAVGNAGQMRVWDGISWAIVASGTTNNLEKVFGLDSTHYYLGGAAGTVLLWDGATITNLNFPDATKRVSAIWGTSPTDMWFGTTPTPGAWWHYDGVAFSEYQSGAPGLFTMEGHAADDIFSGGNLVVQHFDGETWNTVKDYTGFIYDGNAMTSFNSLLSPTSKATVYLGFNPSSPAPADSEVLVKRFCSIETTTEIGLYFALIIAVVAIGGSVVYVNGAKDE